MPTAQNVSTDSTGTLQPPLTWVGSQLTPGDVGTTAVGTFSPVAAGAGAHGTVGVAFPGVEPVNNAGIFALTTAAASADDTYAAGPVAVVTFAGGGLAAVPSAVSCWVTDGTEVIPACPLSVSSEGLVIGVATALAAGKNYLVGYWAW